MVEIPDPERSRLARADRREQPWRRWGPYLSERAWGTVREDYSPGGDAWSFLPFDHAASTAYRWNEDGMGGVCDDQQLLCMALALWNGKDPCLKERPFGLTGEEGNHGEDAKDYWWYLDATPTSSWLEWRYHYPQGVFPYDDLRAVNRARSRTEPEYELLDTGIFDDDRYFAVTSRWAKDGPEDLLWAVTVRNAGPESAVVHVLPTVWFRNRWSWHPDVVKPSLALTGEGEGRHIAVRCDELGSFELAFSDGPAGPPEILFCDNETNLTKLYGTKGPEFPKDGIADHLIHGAPSVNPGRTGTKAAVHHVVELAPGASVEIRLRLTRSGAPAGTADLAAGFSACMVQRRAEADAYYDALHPLGATEEERRVLRQAAAGMLWSKQFYHYDVERWLDGDPGQPAPPSERRDGRNGGWGHLNARDVISMPDPWEYPWFAAWDLAFHCVALAHLDTEFAKRQLILLDREWYMHPNGQLPAYEWNFSDVNPPVQAWAALQVYRIDAASRRRYDPSAQPDHDFLARIFHKLLLNFTWWVNRKDSSGSNVFEGGFLGLDNIGLFDRSKPLPVAGRLEQSDATAWMAMYCLNLLEISLLLARIDPSYEDVASKFFEHFTYIAEAMEAQGLWDDQDGFFYDVIALDSGGQIPLAVRSMVGVVPLFAVSILEPDLEDMLPAFRARIDWFVTNKPRYGAHVADMDAPGEGDRRLLSVTDRTRLTRVLAHCLDPDELLSPHGLRSLSQRHSDYPFTIDLGGSTASIDYEPAESTNYLFGGNSNWRGPVWMPLNYLAIDALRVYHRYYGDSLTVEYPTGSGNRCHLAAVADDLARRLVSLWLPRDDGTRPVFGGVTRLQTDPAWKDQLWFFEYFHGDNGAGLGASHQTGWTGLVVDLLARRRLDGR